MNGFFDVSDVCYWQNDRNHQSLQSTYVCKYWFFSNCMHHTSFFVGNWALCGFVWILHHLQKLLFSFGTISISSLSSASSSAFSAFSAISTFLSCYLHLEMICPYPPLWKYFLSNVSLSFFHFPIFLCFFCHFCHNYALQAFLVCLFMSILATLTAPTFIFLSISW